MPKLKQEIANELVNIKYYVGRIRDRVSQETMEIDNYEDIENIKGCCKIFDELCNSIMLNLE
jgi:hypothetical protein